MDVDRRDAMPLSQSETAKLDQFKAGAEGAGPGGIETEGRLRRLTFVRDGKVLGQKMSQSFSVTPSSRMRRMRARASVTE